MIEDDELLNEFLVESFENLDRLDQDFLDLEQEPDSREILASIFRTVHTIKGTSGFLGFHRLEQVTHVGENLLGKLRDGHLRVDEDVTSSLLRMVDAVREILASIETAGEEGDGDYAEVMTALAAALAGGAAANEPPEVAVAAALSEPPAEPELEVELTAGRLGHLLVERGLCTKAAVLSALRAQLNGDDRRLGEILVERGLLSVNQVLEALGEASVKVEQAEARAAKAVPVASEHGEAGGVRSVSDSSVRVDVGLLDGLIDLVGELVLARNQLLQLTGSRAGKGNATAQASARVSHITSELQDRVMKTRMQPINAVWGKLPRVVRDLSLSLGKQVRVEMEGQDTELDKTIIEAIKDPLTHLVRNAVDHGIERPEVREANGKAAQGRLLLRAFHEGGKVVIEINDDGAGIDPGRVKAKGVEKGVITPEQADAMSDHEAVGLIFQPGFSTAEKVTNVSGRGVGMDVVKTNIEKIGGSLDVQSEVGRGTNLVIRIPLTLAIVPALIVESGGGRFAIPQPNLVELVRLKDSAALEQVDGAMFHRLRGQLLPVVDLSDMLALHGDDHGTRRRSRSLAVLRVDGRQFGLIVDRVSDAEEIVVKPLGHHLKQVELFAGCTIMGDGNVALILDVMAMAVAAGISTARLSVDDRTSGASERTQALLLCLAGGVQVAVPLEHVARLENARRDALDSAGGQEVLTHGSSLLPVVRLGNVVGGYGADDGSDRVKLIVTTDMPGPVVGLIVDQIVDSIHVPLGSVQLQGGAGRFGILGSTVLRGVLTEVVDVEALCQTVDPSFFDAVALSAAS